MLPNSRANYLCIIITLSNVYKQQQQPMKDPQKMPTSTSSNTAIFLTRYLLHQSFHTLRHRHRHKQTDRQTHRHTHTLTHEHTYIRAHTHTHARARARPHVLCINRHLLCQYLNRKYANMYVCTCIIIQHIILVAVVVIVCGGYFCRHYNRMEVMKYGSRHSFQSTF